jgi:hypothetical protein
MMKKCLLILVLLGALAGCVFVGRNATYHRSDVVNQDGSNRVGQVQLQP